MKVVFASLIASAVAQYQGGSSGDEWGDYKVFFEKVYNAVNSDADHRAAFEANLAKIIEQNAKGESLKFGMNQFTDMTKEEYVIAGGLTFNPYETSDSLTPDLGHQPLEGESEALASDIDWSIHGYVTGIKDQGLCGSCWAFASIVSMEAAWRSASGKLVEMSEQQLVDCSSGSCTGGRNDNAFQFAMDNNMCKESSYPYKCKNDATCNHSCQRSCTTAMPKGAVTGYQLVASHPKYAQSISDMKRALASGPFSVVIEADQEAFMHYRSGILTENAPYGGCGFALNHAVAVVGFGNQKGTDYWKIKNSYGKSWGLSGYGLFATAGNTCGIMNTHSVYPVVSASLVV